jgi:hypothetical protein
MSVLAICTLLCEVLFCTAAFLVFAWSLSCQLVEQGCPELDLFKKKRQATKLFSNPRIFLAEVRFFFFFIAFGAQSILENRCAKMLIQMLRLAAMLLISIRKDAMIFPDPDRNILPGIDPDPT